MTQPRTRNRDDGAGNIEILEMAAQCFMEQGFAATSIDDVARRLGATKGRIYHYYSSKTDLFFDVHREGMERLFRAVEPVMAGPGPAVQRLTAMLHAHAMAMMTNVAFEAVVVQGVHMHRMAATTPDQRRTLDALIALRRRFEGLFRQVMEEGIADGSLRAMDVSVGAKAMLGAVNWMSVWYRPLPEETQESRHRLADQIVATQIEGFRRQ
ncbi:TetR/AcrR family transcriptional regulator [Haematobacter genomosp. 1]|uniref:TetR family transcriptional regulator n=1 Tax=Haematobacter genomosp. 1 TaxID=366618 RepID=A0A212AG01_9RHOB|nr:TetR/AcrR family transcriptional regulator [Haematobacter genomosp. 1]OWJ80359.1 TetR family transcriptional regulator [Haematobacter genomosp. 1]